MSHRCYKVVRCVSNRYLSAIVTQRAEVQYHIDQWATAPQFLAQAGYHLFAFNNKKDAVWFLKIEGTEYNSLQLFLSEGENKLPLDNLALDYSVTAGYLPRRRSGGVKILPLAGSCMYEQIKLIERVVVK